MLQLLPTYSDIVVSLYTIIILYVFKPKANNYTFYTPSPFIVPDKKTICTNWSIIANLLFEYRMFVQELKTCRSSYFPLPLSHFSVHRV